jgi:hypothetical protein
VISSRRQYDPVAVPRDAGLGCHSATYDARELHRLTGLDRNVGRQLPFMAKYTHVNIDEAL